MSRGIFNRIFIALIILSGSAFNAGAQAFSSFAPYSIFGFGDMALQGTAYNKSMGGVGVATRNNRFINIMNPAAVTARDTLSFMADFSVYADNKVFRQGDLKSAVNTFNINDLVMSFPLYKTSAMMVGISPYSGTGFAYSYDYLDPEIIGHTGSVGYAASGQGALYEGFVAAGVMFWKRLSLGAQLNLVFGGIEKTFGESFTDSSYGGIKNGSTIQLNGFSGKFGLQYEQPIGAKSKVTVGATYKMGTSFKGYIEEYSYTSNSVSSDTLYYHADTLAQTPGRVKSADEIGIGISYKHGDNFMAEFDYTRADWTGTGLDKQSAFITNKTTTSSTSAFSTSVSQSFRFGLEWVPNRNDIRYYFKRVAYRVGAYYKTDYFKLDGRDITSMGITLGATLPIYRWYNGLTVGMEIGKRGSLADNMVKENYVNFSIGVNIFDIWFQKPKYE